MILESGFKKCKFYNLLNGVVSIHVAYDEWFIWYY
jgi:ubiquinone/menaquinone biosynthesis C-methylase UbiE